MHVPFSYITTSCLPLLVGGSLGSTLGSGFGFFHFLLQLVLGSLHLLYLGLQARYLLVLGIDLVALILYEREHAVELVVVDLLRIEVLDP